MFINGLAIAPGERLTIDLPIPELYTHTPMEMPVHVVRGRRDGPRLFVCAAIHGNELNGVEIVRRLMKSTALGRLRGTLIAVPIVNVYGVIHNSRELPDRRDLNRVFPGSGHGSLASRIADLFMTEIVANASHGIDLHTGAVHRPNVPQVRGDLDDPATLAMAGAFGAPVLLHSRIRDGSLRGAVAERGIPVLVFEGGEALRFDEWTIRVGLRGVLNVMRFLEMIPVRPGRRQPPDPFLAESSTWVRAPSSGFLINRTGLGSYVEEGQPLGTVADPFGEGESTVVSTADGVVIGHNRLPLVNEGDALWHVARGARSDRVMDHIERSRRNDWRAEPL